MNIEELIIENEKLKQKIKLYEISTKLDYEKIEKLKDDIKELKSKQNIRFDN